jgi:cysteine desulfurase
MKEIYLDNAASTRPTPAVMRAVAEAMREAANPSSHHAAGQRARARIEEARGLVAEALHCPAQNVVFTSGGTEANNLAVLGTMTHAGRGAAVICSAVEHSSVWAACDAARSRLGADWRVAPVDRDGTVLLDQLAAQLDDRVALVSVMAVQNEVGTVQPLHHVASLVRQRAPKALFHVDAVQALGKIPCHVTVLGNPDLVSLSAHKVHGPQGVGALVACAWARGRMEPAILGGGQEGGLRCGTEPLPAVAGFGEAVADLIAEGEALARRSAILRDRLAEVLVQLLPDLRVNGPQNFARRAPDNLHISIPGLLTDPLLSALAAAGVACSGGAACSAGKPSRTLQAMGIEWDKAAHLRLSVDWTMPIADVEDAAFRIAQVVGRLR